MCHSIFLGVFWFFLTLHLSFSVSFGDCLSSLECVCVCVYVFLSICLSVSLSHTQTCTDITSAVIILILRSLDLDYIHSFRSPSFLFHYKALECKYEYWNGNIDEWQKLHLTADADLILHRSIIIIIIIIIIIV